MLKKFMSTANFEINLNTSVIAGNGINIAQYVSNELG